MMRARPYLLAVSSLSLLWACGGDSSAGGTFTSGETDSGGVTLTGASATTGGTGTASATDSGTDSAGSASDSGGTSGTSGGTATATTGGTTGGTGGDMCMTDADCVGDPGGPVCDAGMCVPCTPANDVCGDGFYCDPNNTCIPGCLDNDDCPMPLTCDIPNNTCEGCTMDADCALGTVCDMGSCVPGCNQAQPCQAGFACCSDQCVDLDTDVDNCGACDNACMYDNASPSCAGGQCGFTCDQGYEDCNGMAADGCEIMGSCTCTPNDVQACYTGPANTQGVGACSDGEQTCNANGTGWSACTNEVKPIPEVCGNNVDDDCDMTVDEDPDNDNDGWTLCGGDCCDVQGPDCLNPDLVNPGAFEVGGNMVDDDCDGMVDNPVPECDAGLATNSANPLDYAKAIDLCQFTTLNPPNPVDKKWGVITGDLSLANGAGNENANSRSIRNGFGNNITNQFGNRLAVMSTGHAADVGDTNPNYATFQTGQQMGTSSTPPADWFAANGNQFPNAPGCPDPLNTTAFNPVMLTLDIRVPTNANSFSVDLFFFSAEYPEYICTQFNDFFVTLVDSTDPNNPADKNIAIYDDGNNQWPVGVNLVQGNNALFTACTNGTISQCGNPANYNGCSGNAELQGTGFDVNGGVLYACDYGGETGGGTGWITMSGNVTPGEVMKIRLLIFDASDQIFDSLVLLDNWQWSVQASDPGVTPG